MSKARRCRKCESQETLLKLVLLKAFGGKVGFMFVKKILSAGVLCAFLFSYSQENESKIDTVYVFDNQISKIKRFHSVASISEKDILKNTTNLSEVLRFQSPVYIKENGRGAVSSPSFRGTTAQQTAFVWNGININSSFLGQGDINNIGFLTADALEIKSGGGSVIYGSGAIGGSIHLNNTLRFNQGFRTSVFSEAGSFGTFNNLLKTSFSNDTFSVKFSGNYSISQNDFEVEEEKYINRNGKYFNTNFNISGAYKISENQQISWISEFFNGTQHYPVFSETQIKTKYETQNIRSLISWDWKKTDFQNSFKAAYMEENFQYSDDIRKPETSGGTGKNIILKNDLNYFFNKKWNADIIAEFQNNKGEGYESGIENVERNSFSATVLLWYFASEKLKFEAGIKKDFVENISSPFLFSISGKWDAAKWYSLGLDISKNFRYGSFNDLYWKQGGNPDLKPETSIQFEMENQFKINDFKISVTPYFMKIEDMIRWLPTNLGYWAVFNTNKVKSYGLEAQLNYRKNFGKHRIKADLGYSYSKSENEEMKKQLMYVPLHKAFGMANYQYDFFGIYVQGIFNGLTFTDSEEKRSEALNPYFVFNAGTDLTVLQHYKIGFRINNIFNEIYATTRYYFMPKRNYNVNININF